MTLWERVRGWFTWDPPAVPEVPEFERPPVPLTPPEEQARAEAAVRLLQSYVQAQGARYRADRERRRDDRDR